MASLTGGAEGRAGSPAAEEPAQGAPGPASLVVLLTGLLVPLALRARRRRDP